MVKIMRGLQILDLGISVAGHPFVHVGGSVGLTESDAIKLTNLLEAIK